MSISCLCITYLRTSFLEEAIECFLRQTYKGPKELIIINDAEDQYLEFNHPEVLVVNTKRRFKTIGEKRNASAALAKYDYLATWDDDDIFLPHRLEYCHNKISNNKLDYYKLEEAFFCSNNQISKTSTNLFFSSSIFSRKLYEETSGHGFINSGQDLHLETQLEKMCRKNKYKMLVENTIDGKIKKEDIYYIYRWDGVSYHLSQSRRIPNPLEFIKNERKKFEKITGHIILNPHWEKDYVQICKDFLNSENPVSEYKKYHSYSAGRLSSARYVRSKIL